MDMDSGESDYKVTDEMVSLVPQLHTFARSLCRDGVRADDLVQEALLRAFNNIKRFKPGTNLKAWLFTIVRNEHYSQLRRRKFEAHDISGDSLPEPSVPPDHDGELELRDLNRALSCLSPGQRAALILVSASGFSYDEAASICGCAVGTIKSRVARARSSLLAMLDGRVPVDKAQRCERSQEASDGIGQHPALDHPRARSSRAGAAASRRSPSPERRYVVHSSFGEAPRLR
ncbi:MAG TPA: sigma-70 family RNA polymerase sigma factor [Steroidobacteraceae bacterium]|nr:sigma-70 family RNA polymerase sigma factor [Steroidobacteraceae bacterium]